MRTNRRPNRVKEEGAQPGGAITGLPRRGKSGQGHSNSNGRRADAPEYPIPERRGPDLPLPPQVDPSKLSAAERERLETAEQVIERGYPIVLLHGARNYRCACYKGEVCEHPGKHPVGRGWNENPNRTVPELRCAVWSRMGKETNFGCLLLEEQRLLFLDEDNKKGKKGRETLIQWGQELGIRFEDYLAQITPTGGNHYLF
ncbi:bifunctional DNA primase/polymerase, partial [Gemmatimonadota bacterium]